MNAATGTVLAGKDHSRNRRRRTRCYVMGLVTVCAAVVLGIAVPAPSAVHPAARNVVPQGVGGWDAGCVAITAPSGNGVGGWDSACVTIPIPLIDGVTG